MLLADGLVRARPDARNRKTIAGKEEERQNEKYCSRGQLMSLQHK